MEWKIASQGQYSNYARLVMEAKQDSHNFETHLDSLNLTSDFEFK